MIWRFSINNQLIEEPTGWNDLTLSVRRDPDWHGIFFEASASSLGFYGEAFRILKELKQNQGLFARAIFRADLSCDGETFEEVYTGKMNFGQYRETCGRNCFIYMPVEQDNCTMIMRSRYDQKVNIDSNIAFDKQTVLEDYAALGMEMELAAQNIPVSVEGFEPAEGETLDIDVTDNPDTDGFIVGVRPTYSDERDNSINQGQLIPGVTYFELIQNVPYIPVSPQLLLDDSPRCFTGEFDVLFRLKGRFSMNTNAVGLNLEMLTRLWDAEGDFNEDATLEDQQSAFAGDYVAGTVIEFDMTFSVTMPIEQGQGIYNYLNPSTFSNVNQTPTLHIEFDPETHVKIEAVKACPVTTAVVNGVHETISRAVEAITNLCVTAKSDYYGRTDSEPYAPETDGCGGLRVLTNGLKIRQAETDDFFISLKEIFEGLRGIDNIGMGIEDAPFDRKYLRVEPVEYFYNDQLLLTIDAVAEMETAIAEARAKAKILIGYKEWETESTKGLDEFNSNREYRTGVDSVSNTLDATSGFIAAGYVIEFIRSQLFAETGRADNKYDNHAFIICVIRAAYDFQVEQGVTDNASNIFSPSTVYNWRIRPFSNLMRWAKSILQVYPNPAATDSKIFFSAGTGNYLASGELPAGDPCKLENGPKAENRDLHISDFLEAMTPLLSLDDKKYEYPLSVADYKKIKANPYGYINLQCGVGDFEKAYISSIEWKPSTGMADFDLIKKWE